MFHSSAQSSTNANMVAVGTGQRQLTGTSKEEYPRWLYIARSTLNQLRVLDSEAGDKLQSNMGNPIRPENYGKKRGIVTAEMLVEDPGLSNAGFKVGDILLEGSDRREFVKAVEQRERERKTVISTILLLAKADSPLFHVLTAASKKNKDPNALLEAAELLYNSPCMATCLSIVADERTKIDKIQEDTRMQPLPAQRAIHQVAVESKAHFLNIFTSEQHDTPDGLLRILELRNFCVQVNDLERTNSIQNDLQTVNFINQYVRGHKGPPLEYDTDGFWRDIDAHQVVFHQSRKGAKTGRQQRADGGKVSSVAQGSSSLTEEEASMVKHLHVLKKGKSGSKRHQAALAAIQSLGFKVEDSADTKDRGVCFRMRDTGECTYGKKCRYSHDKARIKEAKEAKEAKATVSVFSVPEATNDSDYALHALSRKVRKTKSPRRKRVSYCGEESSESDDISVASSPRMIDYMIEGEWPADPDRGTDERHSPSVSMLSPSKKLKTKHQA